MTEPTFTLLRCTSTCYMPLKKGDKVLERFEDDSRGRDIVAHEVPNNLVTTYLKTDHFVRV